jgi:hypothetical protein
MKDIRQDSDLGSLQVTDLFIYLFFKSNRPISSLS